MAKDKSTGRDRQRRALGYGANCRLSMSFMLDTAGRLAMSIKQLMDEMKAVSSISKSDQACRNAARRRCDDRPGRGQRRGKAFGEKVGLTGIMLTRMDGDARGGAALSMRAVTGKPIKLLGTGEKLDSDRSVPP
jgi:signal recognition particle subunit SRP54